MKGLSFGRNKETGEAAGAAGGKVQGSPLWVYFLPSLVVAMVLLVLLGMVSVQLVGNVRDEVSQRNALLVAEATVKRIVGVLDAKAGLLQLLSSQEDVQQALAEPEPQGLAEAAAQMAGQLPEIVQLRLYPLEWISELKPDPTGAAPMGYAGVDMIKRALGGQRPAAEIHQISAGNPYLAMAVPVRREGRVTGALFVAWPVDLLSQVLSSTPPFGGEIQLLQGGAGGSVIAASGALTPLKRAEGSRDVPGSIWQLSYELDAAAADDDFYRLAGVALGGIIAMVLVLWLQMRLFNRDMRQDMATVVNLGENIAIGKVGAKPKVRVGVSRNAILLLSEYARKSSQQRRKAQADSAHKSEPDSLLVPGLAASGIEVEHESEPTSRFTEHVEVSASIFRAYDVRGIVGQTLSADVAFVLAQAFAEEALKQNVEQVCVAHDARLSSPELYKAFCDGLIAQGMQVLQLGQVPVAIPYLYMHTNENTAAVMVTGSHNPAEYNGFKLYINAQALQGEQLQALYQRVSRGGFVPVQKGRAEQLDMRSDYVQVVSEQTQVGRPLKVVVDGGNGVAGELACDLLTAIGCEVVPLFCEPDGNFPNHHPDPSERENLSALQLEVQAQSADLGIAFDGDGDRLGVIDNAGNYVWPEHLLMLLSADVLQRHPGTDVVFDVKSSRNLAAYVLANGGRPIMSRSGHTRMKEKMRETGALLGGEFSGHFFIKERWYGSDDAIYTAARLLEALAVDPRPLEEVIAELPSSHATPEYHMQVEEADVQPLMQRINANADFKDARLVTLDGLRVEFTHGWGLVRASNTTPSLTFRFEADSEAALQDIQQKFRDLVNQVLPAAQLPF